MLTETLCKVRNFVRNDRQRRSIAAEFAINVTIAAGLCALVAVLAEAIHSSVPYLRSIGSNPLLTGLLAAIAELLWVLDMLLFAMLLLRAGWRALEESKERQ